MEGADCLSLFDGEALDVSGTSFAGQRGFTDPGRLDREDEAGLGKEFAAAW